MNNQKEEHPPVLEGDHGVINSDLSVRDLNSFANQQMLDDMKRENIEEIKEEDLQEESSGRKNKKRSFKEEKESESSESEDPKGFE